MYADKHVIANKLLLQRPHICNRHVGHSLLLAAAAARYFIPVQRQEVRT